MARPLYFDLSKPNVIIMRNREAYKDLLTRMWFDWGNYNIVAYKTRLGYHAYIRIDGLKYKEKYCTRKEFEKEVFIAAL